MPERPQHLLDRDKKRRSDIELARSDAAFGKHTMSRPWQAYNQMQTMQRQANPDLDRLKDVRRDWNRNLKYTPAGMAAAGVSTPQGAMEGFRTGTEAFRQTNKPAYNRMYPISGMAMDYPEKGGILGMAAGNFLKNIFPGGGVDSLISEGDKERYISETFGPHLEDVPYGGPSPDDYEGPWPHEDMPIFPDIYRGETPHEGIPPLDVYEGPKPHEDFSTVAPQDTPINWDLENNKYYQDLNQAEIDYLMGRTEEIADEDMNILGDMGLGQRQMGLEQFVDEMPTSKKSDWEDYLSYVQRLGDMPGGHLEYDEWHDMMRKRR